MIVGMYTVMTQSQFMLFYISIRHIQNIHPQNWMKTMDESQNLDLGLCNALLSRIRSKIYQSSFNFAQIIAQPMPKFLSNFVNINDITVPILQIQPKCMNINAPLFNCSLSPIFLCHNWQIMIVNSSNPDW